jgi:aminoglycoside phosphotransferase (APT) family kinase protein
MTMENIRVKLTDFYEKQIDQTAEITVFDLDKLTSGWETEVYSFDIEFRRKSDYKQENLILRTFPGTGGKEKAVYEFHLMKNLAKNKYPVPKAHHLVSQEKYLGYPFIIMERLKGGTLSKAMREASKGEKTQLTSLFVECFVKLHDLDWKTIVPNPRHYEFNSQFESIKNSLQSIKQEANHYELEEFLEVVIWLEERVSIIPTEELSLVHFDYHPSNIVLSKEKKPFVIDWTVSRVSDFRIDLGWTLLLQSTYGAYQNRNIILNEYQKFCNSRVDNIEFFEVIAALRRLFVMAISLTGQNDVVGTRPEVDEILRGHTKHVDGVIRIMKDRTGITLHEFETMVKNASSK